MRDWPVERHHGPTGERWATRRPWGGGLPRPAGQKPYGRGAARRSAGPHPPAGGAGRNGVPDDRQRHLAGASSAPGILSPRKDHRQGRARGRVAGAMAQAPPLTLIFLGKTSAPIGRTDLPRLVLPPRCQPVLGKSSASGQSRMLLPAASRISCASMPTRDSPVPSVGQWQTNSSGPLGGSGQAHNREC
jgi:hypothetical protein